jgi:hypothetical protein
LATTRRSSKPGDITPTQLQHGIVKGYRSGLEEVTSTHLEAEGFPDCWEVTKVRYVVPARNATYTPDFTPVPDYPLHIETKGVFDAADRQKMILVKDQNPGLDIRFVFSNANAPIYTGPGKRSPTTNAMWAAKHGFNYAHRKIPPEWFAEFRTIAASLKKRRK